jgi:hypothetical protein
MRQNSRRHRPATLARLLALGAALLCAPSIGAAQRGGGGGTFGCQPADSTTMFIIAGLQRVVTSNDSSVVATRQTMQVPAGPASSVVLVNDNSICNKVAQAYNAAFAPKTPPVSPSANVYVVKVGTVYVVDDSVRKAGEWVVSMTVNTKYKVLARYSR